MENRPFGYDAIKAEQYSAASGGIDRQPSPLWAGQPARPMAAGTYAQEPQETLINAAIRANTLPTLMNDLQTLRERMTVLRDGASSLVRVTCGDAALPEEGPLKAGYGAGPTPSGLGALDEMAEHIRVLHLAQDEVGRLLDVLHARICQT